MRHLAIILLFGISINLFSQEISGIEIKKKHQYSEDSELRVIYKDSLTDIQIRKSPAYFINGIQIENETILKSLNPNKIESINVEKENLVLNGKEYYGTIKIKTKKNYELKLITLKELANKYLPTETNPRIFQIDENLIKENENKYLVDENYILKIELTTIKNSELNSDVNFIKLITKTPENIKKANQILIRGKEI